ncbi:MAG: hypothetical protein IMZ43_06480 [Thermoplasmata archaeon]|nr:hypothetical protein [Thermoplasmata archaeon]
MKIVDVIDNGSTAELLLDMAPHRILFDGRQYREMLEAEETVIGRNIELGEDRIIFLDETVDDSPLSVLCQRCIIQQNGCCNVRDNTVNKCRHFLGVKHEREVSTC